jgi:hypothetical protein
MKKRLERVKNTVNKYMADITTTSTFLFYLVCEAFGTAATPGLLCQPRVIVLGGNLPQRHFCPSQPRST